MAAQDLSQSVAWPLDNEELRNASSLLPFLHSKGGKGRLKEEKEEKLPLKHHEVDTSSSLPSRRKKHSAPPLPPPPQSRADSWVGTIPSWHASELSLVL